MLASDRHVCGQSLESCVVHIHAHLNGTCLRDRYLHLSID